MKKILALLLVAFMCLSLIACGDKSDTTETQSSGENAENIEDNNTNTDTNQLTLCQEWKAISNGDVISFDKNGNFHINGEIYSYTYNEETNKIIVDIVDLGIQINLDVSLVDGIYRINVDGTEYAPASEYERLHAEYAQTKMVISGFDGTPALNAVLVAEHIERVELNIDNWKNYIKEYSYDIERIQRDAFGEIIKKEKFTVYRLGYGTEKYHCLNATIELKHKQTGEMITLGSSITNIVEDVSPYQYSPFNLDEYECTRIKGYIYFINYPEEIFEEVLNVHELDDNHHNRYNASINVTDDWSEGVWSVDVEGKVIESQSDDWKDYFE